ncbi:hypothetical protein WMW72_17435 [Paenibacillus filicis]|uniref:Uncharacterized protein n=1 Tax=Paenibacillus filicis TaxID=669464 RepID=A0ABU9DNB0_9BACL
MTTYWLVPVSLEGPAVIFGSERFQLEPEELRMRFSRSLQGVHPRLLLPFKAHLLLSDAEAEACGTDELPFALGDAVDIVLYAEGKLPKAISEPDSHSAGDLLAHGAWEISHCAGAYLSGLMSPLEAEDKLKLAKEEPGAEAWYAAIRRWLSEGRRVMMLRED